MLDLQLASGVPGVVGTAGTPQVQISPGGVQGTQVSDHAGHRYALAARRPHQRVVDIDVDDLVQRRRALVKAQAPFASRQAL
jgi:hypothetical protein